MLAFLVWLLVFVFFKQKTAYEMRISDGSSDVCSSDLAGLLDGEKTEFREWEKDTPYFEGCMPIEVAATRGLDTLRYGPMKPVGLDDPRTGRWPYAVVQLRQDNATATLWNIIGFQTKLKHAEQVRLFSTIPELRSEKHRPNSNH